MFVEIKSNKRNVRNLLRSWVYWYLLTLFCKNRYCFLVEVSKYLDTWRWFIRRRLSSRRYVLGPLTAVANVHLDYPLTKDTLLKSGYKAEVLTTWWQVNLIVMRPNWAMCKDDENIYLLAGIQLDQNSC